MDGVPDSDAIIRVRDLVVGFGKQRVLDGLSLDVHRGEILGLVGGSGSGKSVLLRTIIGLIPKRQGSIEVLGVDLDHAGDEEHRAIERRWGVLFQQGALFSSLTALENVEFPMREYLDVSDRLRRELATAKLEMVGLSPSDGNKLPSELSGGMTKRVALARALALDPEIVFLDEPTSGLDPITAKTVDAEIIKLRDVEHVTSILVTHQLQDAFYIARHEARNQDGRLAIVKAEGPMHEQARFLVLKDGKVFFEGIAAELHASTDPFLRSYLSGWVPPLVA